MDHLLSSFSYTGGGDGGVTPVAYKMFYVILGLTIFGLALRYWSVLEPFEIPLYPLSDKDFQKRINRVEKHIYRDAIQRENQRRAESEMNYQKQIRAERDANTYLSQRQFSLLGEMLGDIQSNKIYWSPLEPTGQRDQTQSRYKESEDLTDQSVLEGIPISDSTKLYGPDHVYANYNRLRGFPSALPPKKLDEI